MSDTIRDDTWHVLNMQQITQLVALKDANSLTMKKLSQPTKPSITKKVMIDIPHTNDMDNNNLSSQTP